jgi:hypothetical protein
MESEEVERILCDDRCCIGTVNEKGFCGACGKLRATGRVQEEYPPIPYPSFDTTEASRKWDIDDIVPGVLNIVTGILKGVICMVVVLVVLGILLFLAFTFLRVGWKFIKWAWE